MADTGWQVTAQREDTQATPDGRVAQGVVVSFVTPSGIAGSVFVPNAEYNPAKVRAAIAARVATMEAVHKLTGS